MPKNARVKLKAKYVLGRRNPYRYRAVETSSSCIQPSFRLRSVGFLHKCDFLYTWKTEKERKRERDGNTERYRSSMPIRASVCLYELSAIVLLETMEGLFSRYRKKKDEVIPRAHVDVYFICAKCDKL